MLIDGWSHLMRKLQIQVDTTDCYQQICRSYHENNRYYHNLYHIADCLKLLDQYPDAVEDCSAVELAIWFHDVIYDPKQTDNEEQSAVWGGEQMGRWLLDCTLIETVQKLIRITDHKQTYRGGDAALIQDIDLEILGCDPVRYQDYSCAIRQEYDCYPDAIYKVGRRQVLESFLSREKIFQTDYYYSLFEAKARKNILNELNTYQC